MQQKEIFNPNFLDAAGDYLEANGFKKSYHPVEDTIYYVKGRLGASITGDSITFTDYHDEEPEQRKAGYYAFMSVKMIKNLDFFKWMCLFHIADLVPIKDFLKLVPQEDVVDFTNTTLANHKPNYQAIAI